MSYKKKQWRGGLHRLITEMNRGISPPPHKLKSFLGKAARLSERHALCIALVAHCQDTVGYATIGDIREYFYPEGTISTPRQTSYKMLRWLIEEHGLIEKVGHNQYRLTRAGANTNDYIQDYWRRDYESL